jgi:hypothetical protein
MRVGHATVSSAIRCFVFKTQSQRGVPGRTRFAASLVAIEAGSDFLAPRRGILRLGIAGIGAFVVIWITYGREDNG